MSLLKEKCSGHTKSHYRAWKQELTFRNIYLGLYKYLFLFLYLESILEWRQLWSIFQELWPTTSPFKLFPWQSCRGLTCLTLWEEPARSLYKPAVSLQWWQMVGRYLFGQRYFNSSLPHSIVSLKEHLSTNFASLVYFDFTMLIG